MSWPFFTANILKGLRIKFRNKIYVSKLGCCRNSGIKFYVIIANLKSPFVTGFAKTLTFIFCKKIKIFLKKYMCNP